MADASSGGGFIASPSLDDIPILALVLVALSISLVGMAGGDGVVTAPLLDSLLVSIVAMADPVDVDVVVAAVTPHQTPPS